MSKAKTGQKGERVFQKARTCPKCEGKLQATMHMPGRKVVWHCEKQDSHRFSRREV